MLSFQVTFVSYCQYSHFITNFKKMVLVVKDAEFIYLISQRAGVLGSKQMRLTAWIISVSKGSGSGLMFRSSNSKRTAILVISISSSGWK